MSSRYMAICKPHHERISQLRLSGRSYRDIATIIFKNIKLFGDVRNYCDRVGITKYGSQSNQISRPLTEQKSTYVREIQSDYIPRVPRILIIDIETSPHVSFHFGVFKQFINPKQIIRQQVILTVSMKWVGEDEKHILRLDDYEGAISKVDEYISTRLCDKRLLMDLWHFLDRADIIVAHNGKRFDNGWIKQRMIYHGIPLPSPYKVIDTLQVIRKELSLPRNTLESAAIFFDLDIKKRDISMDCWIRCMFGEEAAFDEMVEYNIDDIDVLELLYLLIRPIDSTHPNMALLTGQMHACPHCAATDSVETHKDYFTSANGFKMYRCNNCSGYFRSRKTFTRGATDSRTV